MSGNRLDDIAPAFRAAVERWPDAANLQQHYRELVRAWEGEGSSVIELIKSFLECVCWTVLNELGAEGLVSSTPTTTELLARVLDALGLRHQRGVGPLGRVISAHNRLAEALNEYRNQDGSVAHGRDAFLDAIANRHMRVYLLSADSVIALILSAYDGREPNLRTTREPPERFRHLNERIDAGCTLDAEVDLEDGVLVVRIWAGTQTQEEAIELRVPPSELLYHLDRQAYISVLEALQGTVPSEEEDVTELVGEEEGEAVEAIPEEEPAVPSELAAEPVRQQLLDDYQGRFREKVHLLYEFVVHRLLGGRGDQAEQVYRFVNTLLAKMEDLAVVDWSRHEPKRAAVRVALKRLIRLADIDGLDEEAVEPLLDWLRREIENGNGHG